MVRFSVLVASILALQGLEPAADFVLPANGAGELSAQAPATGSITGTVTGSTTGRPLGNVQLYVPDTGFGALTTPAGRFLLLNLPLGPITLRAQLIGYAISEAQVEIRAGETSPVDFVLERRAIDLEGVVATVDAAEASRAAVGTDFERFDARLEMEKAAVSNLSDLMSGRAGGVDIQQATGPVGTASRIRVRGVTSLSQGSNPIIIMDGIRVSNATDRGPESIDWTEGRTFSRIDDINPQDIESIQIIKGPTATALYGSEAASGVILIETRKGRTGAHGLTASWETGFVQDNAHYWDKWYNFTKFMGITDVNSPIAQQWNAEVNPVTGDVWGFHNSMTNSLTSPLRTGWQNTFNLSVNGGGRDIQYFVSGRYEKSDGPYPVNTLERGSLRGNLTARTSEKFEISVSTNYVESDTRVPESSRSFRGYSTNGGAGGPLTSFGVRPDGSRGDCLGTLAGDENVDARCERQRGNLISNFDNLNTVYSGQELKRFVGSATGTWTPASWFTNRFTIGVDFSQEFDLNEFPLDEDRPFGVLSAGFVRDQRYTNSNRTAEYTGTVVANASSTIQSTTTFGAQYFQRRSELVGCIGEGGFASPTATACEASLNPQGFSGLLDNKQAGVYLQQRFGFDNRLFVSGGLRYDDNSAFGENQSGIVSPSFNASWVASAYDWWNISWWSSMRFRIAFGTAAQAPPQSASLTRLIPVRLETGGTQITGVSAAFPGNQDLTAERKQELEMGFDAGLLDERLSFKFTYFRQQTKDAILERFLAPSAGFRGQQWINVGELQNNGWEAQIGAQLVNTQSFQWDLDYRHSTQNPIVTDMGEFPPLLLGGNRGAFIEGFPPGSYYGPIISSANRNADGTIDPNSVVVQPGDLGLTGSQADYSFLGSPQPTNFQSLSTTFTMLEGRLSLSTMFDRKGNVRKNNGTSDFHVSFGRDFAGTREYAFRESEMTPEEQAGMEKSLVEGGIHRDFVFAEDGSFIKWREITLTYRVPEQLVWGNPTSVTIGSRNLYTWTDYRGLDPEAIVVGGRTEFVANEEFYGEAVPRRFFARVQVQF